LAAYLVTSVGIPRPLTAGKSVAAQAYPCDGHACGCRSAEQCWKSCCCHSPAQRLAWARAHQIQPPSELIALAARPEPRPCCKGAAIAAANQPQAIKSCCSSKFAGGAQEARSKQETAKPSREQMLYGFMALKCRGASTQWTTTGAVTSPPAKLIWQPFAACCDWIHPASVVAPVSHDAPPTPPPRLS
jgi:hypothetical protein